LFQNPVGFETSSWKNRQKPGFRCEALEMCPNKTNFTRGKNFMNKKLGFAVILTLVTSVMGFSNENRLSMGFEYGNFFKKKSGQRS
jgi:hypothetical protein